MSNFVSFIKIYGTVVDKKDNPVRRWNNPPSSHNVMDLKFYKDTFELGSPETTLYLTKKSYTTFENNIDQALKSSKNITGKTIYVAPGVNLPRTKLREYCVENNLKIVRDCNKADNIIISKKTTSAMLKDTYARSYTNSVEKVLSVFGSNPDFFPCGTEKLKELISEYPNLCFDGQYDLSAVFDEFTRTSDLSVRYCLKHSRYVDFFEAVVEEKLNLIPDISILGEVNKTGNLTIDSETFESLELMLKSTDVGNHSLAMEIMANSNYEESATYLYLLFKDYHYKMQSAQGYKHVNFSALINYLGINRHTDLHFDNIVSKMVDKKLLDKENLTALFDKCQGDFKNSSSYFHVNTFKLTKELQDYFDGENMIYDAH